MIIPGVMKFCCLQLVRHSVTLPCMLAFFSTLKHVWLMRLILFDNSVGKDATNDFEDVGHSDSARDMMEKYYIGEVDPSTVPLKRTYVPPPQARYNPDKISEFVIKILQFLVPLLILGLAFAARHYTKKE